MKLGKRTLLVIAIGIFVVVGISLSMVRSQQVKEQNQLNEELILARSNLERVQPEKLSSQQAVLESRLSQATSQLEGFKTTLSEPIGGIAVSDIVFNVAKAHGVEVIEMTSPGRTSGSLEELVCSVISLTAKVEGDLPNLVDFIINLNRYLATSVVKAVKITIPETENGEKASADIQLIIYSYQEE